MKPDSSRSFLHSKPFTYLALSALILKAFVSTDRAVPPAAPISRADDPNTRSISTLPIPSRTYPGLLSIPTAHAAEGDEVIPQRSLLAAVGDGVKSVWGRFTALFTPRTVSEVVTEDILPYPTAPVIPATSTEPVIVREYVPTPVQQIPVFTGLTYADVDRRIAAALASIPQGTASVDLTPVYDYIRRQANVTAESASRNSKGIAEDTVTDGSQCLSAISLSLTTPLAVSSGGTGTSTSAYGKLLLGNATGGYNLVATSSLGISGGGFDVSELNTLATIAVGDSNVVSGIYASAFGYNNTASGQNSSASGYLNTASGDFSSAFGFNNTASGQNSSASGFYNTASCLGSSASGYSNTASGYYSSAFGFNNTASGQSSSAFGFYNTASDSLSSAFGYYNTASGYYSSAFGYRNTASGYCSSASGYLNTAAALNSSAFGRSNFTGTGGLASIQVGVLNNSTGGTLNTTTGAITGTPSACTTVGRLTTAVGVCNKTAGNLASAFGYNNTASGYRSSAFGSRNTASGCLSSASGYLNTASGQNSSASGYLNTASGQNSSAFGYYNTASGCLSSAFGYYNTASGCLSSAFGSCFTNATSSSVAIGTCGGWLNVQSNGCLTTATGAYLTTGGTWSNASSRDLKENFTTLDPQDILSKISALPITRWNYKIEDDSVTHIGPVAQDFYNIFNTGGSDTSISTIDPAGVALLGIQGLSTRVDRLNASSTASTLSLSSLSKSLDAQRLSIEGVLNSVSSTASTTAAAIASLDVKIGQLAARIGDIESGASTTTETIIVQSDDQSIISYLASFGARVIDGVIHFVDVVVERLTVGSLTIKNEADVSQTGFVIYDRATHRPICVYFENGVQKTAPGECDDEDVVSDENIPDDTNSAEEDDQPDVVDGETKVDQDSDQATSTPAVQEEASTSDEEDERAASDQEQGTGDTQDNSEDVSDDQNVQADDQIADESVDTQEEIVEDAETPPAQEESPSADVQENSEGN